MTLKTLSCWLGAAALAGVLLWGPGLLAKDSPRAHLEDVTTGLLTQIRVRQSELKEDNAALHTLVAASLKPILDYDRIVKIVLGKKHYGQATPQQREEFVVELRKQLVRLYAETILSNAHGEVRYLPFELQPDKKYQVVKTKFLLPGRAPFDLHYLMRDVEGVWRVFEIRAGGIFLVKSLTKTLRPEIDQKGLETVIERWRGAAAVEVDAPVAPHTLG